MKKLFRTALFAGVVAFGVSACGDDVQVVDPADTPHPPLSVQLTPQNVSVAAGASVDLAVSVSGGDPALSPQWTCTSSDTDVATTTVTATGCRVTGVSTGTATIIAVVERGDQSTQAAAAVSVAELVEATVSISQINQADGSPADIGNISGQLNVVLNINPGDELPERVDVLVDDEVVASQVFTAQQVAAFAELQEEGPAEQVQQVTLAFRTDRYDVDEAAGTASIWHENGQKEISAQLHVAQDVAPRASNVITVNFNNEDGYHVVGVRPDQAENSALDSEGRRWFGGPGAEFEITAIPVFYSSEDLDQVTIAFCNESETLTEAPYRHAFECPEYETPDADNADEPTLSGLYEDAGDSTGGLILNATAGTYARAHYAASYRFPVRVDTRAPAADNGQIVLFIGTDEDLMNRENWINEQYGFDWGYDEPEDEQGVSATGFMISRTFRVHDSGDPATAATVDDDIVLEGEETGADLDPTDTNAQYHLSAEVCDRLNNCRVFEQEQNPFFTSVAAAAPESHAHTTFGFDNEQPTLTSPASDATVQFWTPTFELTSTDQFSGFAPPATGEGVFHALVRVRGTPGQPTNLNREPLISLDPAEDEVVATPFATSLEPAFVTTPIGVTTYVRTPTELQFTQSIDDTDHGDVPAYYIYQAQVRDKAGNLSDMFWARAYQNSETNAEVTGLTPAAFYAGGDQIEFAAVGSDPVEVISASFDLRYATVGRFVFDRNPDVLGVKFTDEITRPVAFAHVYRETYQNANILDGFIRSLEHTDARGRPTGDLNKPNQVQSRVYSGYTTVSQPDHIDDFAAGDGASDHFSAPVLADAVEDGVAYPAGTAAANPQAIGPEDVDDTQATDGGSLGFIYDPAGNVRSIMVRGVTAQFVNPFDHVVVFGRVEVDGGAEDWLVPLGRASAAGSLDNGIHRDFYWTFNFGSGAHAAYDGFVVVGVNSAWDGLLAQDVTPVATTAHADPDDEEQTFEPGPISTELTVVVADQFGPLEGESVTFTITTDGTTGTTAELDGDTDPVVVVTNVDGEASVTLTADGLDTEQVVITAQGPGDPVTFTITFEAQ